MHDLSLYFEYSWSNLWARESKLQRTCFHGMGAEKRGWFQLLFKAHSSCSCGCQVKPSMSSVLRDTCSLYDCWAHKKWKNLILLSFYYVIIIPMFLADLESVKTSIILRAEISKIRGYLCYTFKIYVFFILLID